MLTKTAEARSAMTDKLPERHGGYVPGVRLQKKNQTTRSPIAKRELRCAGCGTLCADAETLSVHERFCPRLVEHRATVTYSRGPRLKKEANDNDPTE